MPKPFDEIMNIHENEDSQETIDLQNAVTSKTFDEILSLHEKEDIIEIASYGALYKKLQFDYVNFDEMLTYLHDERKLSALEAIQLSDYDFNGKIIPKRHEEIFKIRKHTKVQVPYLHNHDFFELIYVLKGKCVQLVGNTSQNMTIQENQICLVAPDVPHKLSKVLGDEIIFKLHIPTAIFSRCTPLSMDTYADCQLYTALSPQVKNLIIKLLQERDSNNLYCDRAIDSYLTLLLIELQRDPRRNNHQIVHDLAEYLQDNYMHGTLQDFAKTIGYNAVYTGKMIKIASQKTFSELLLEYKLQQAIKLLTDTDISVEHIADTVGYTHASGLYKSFFATYGMTPSEYRHSIQR